MSNLDKIIQLIRGEIEITNPDLTLVAKRVQGRACPVLSVESNISGVKPLAVLSPKERGKEEGKK